MSKEIEKNLKDKIIKLLQEGISSKEIAKIFGINKMQVAGIKAHLTLSKKQNNVSFKIDNSNYLEYLNNSGIWSNTAPPKNIAKNTDNVILVGTDNFFNKKVYWRYNPIDGSVNPHLLIVGETGYGKTYATQCIISELKNKNISCIVFDYGQGFGIDQANQDFLDLAKPTQIDASKNGVAINPLEVFPDDIKGPVNVAQRTADIFCRIYSNLGIQQKEAIIEAILASFRLKNIPIINRNSHDNLPEFNSVYNMLREIAETDKHPLQKYAKTAFSHISSFFRFNVIRTEGEKITWKKMINKKGSTWIIQLKGLDQYVSVITTEMLLWNLICYLQSSGLDSLKLFIVLDEAHKLSFDHGSPVEWILREGRKFGVGVILASQQITDYSKVAISNTATKLIFQNLDYRNILSKALAKKCKNLSDYKTISRIITTLERGKAFFLSENIGRVVAIDSIRNRGL